MICQCWTTYFPWMISQCLTAYSSGCNLKILQKLSSLSILYLSVSFGFLLLVSFSWSWRRPSIIHHALNYAVCGNPSKVRELHEFVNLLVDVWPSDVRLRIVLHVRMVTTFCDQRLKQKKWKKRNVFFFTSLVSLSMFIFIFLKCSIIFFSVFKVSLSFFKFTAHLCWFMHLYPYPGLTILNT